MVFHSFAVIGTGNLGAFVIAELLRLKAVDSTVSSVTIVSRSIKDATVFHPDWVSQGAKFAAIDHDDKCTLRAAFEGVEVAISTVKGLPEALQSQKALADAAKAAGVKIFVPSDFGGASTNPFAKTKVEIHGYLEKIELPYAIFYTGAWSDLIFIPRFGFDLVNGKINVPGSGNTPITFTGRPDIARYIGFAFTNLPAEKLEWGTFRLEGERMTFNEILKSYQEKTRRILEIEHISSSELEKRTDGASVIGYRWEKGDGVVGDPTDTNDLYPGWNPKKVLEYLT